eukprot:jgi/Mesvir1/20017/Mv13269-RA.2
MSVVCQAAGFLLLLYVPGILCASHALDCPAVQTAWTTWHQTFLSSKINGSRHRESGRKSVAKRVGCEAYQLSGDFSWLSRVQPQWVPPEGKKIFSSLQARQQSWKGKRSTGQLCRCTPLLSEHQYTTEGLQVMLFSAMSNEAVLLRKQQQTHTLKELVANGTGGLVMVGNSAQVESMGKDMGAWIDAHGVVLRFNTNWRRDKAQLIGSKRDVWVVGDYTVSTVRENIR